VRALLRLRVLVVDDHSVLRDGLRGVLTDEPDMDVVGEAEHGAEALARVAAAAVDGAPWRGPRPDLRRNRASEGNRPLTTARLVDRDAPAGLGPRRHCFPAALAPAADGNPNDPDILAGVDVRYVARELEGQVLGDRLGD